MMESSIVHDGGQARGPDDMPLDLNTTIRVEIVFHRCPINSTASLYQQFSDGTRHFHSTIRSKEAFDLKQIGVDQIGLPFQVLLQANPGNVFLLLGRQNGEELGRISVRSAPPVQRHAIHVVPSAGAVDALLAPANNLEDSSLTFGSHQPVSIGEEEEAAVEVLGPLLQGCFAPDVESRYDAAFSAAVAAGLVTEAELDALTDEMAQTCGRAAAGAQHAAREGVMQAQLSMLWKRQQETAARPLLSSLPPEVLELVLLHAQSAAQSTAGFAGCRPTRGCVLLARCSATCRTMHQVAESAAGSYARSAGLCLALARCPPRFFAQRRHAVRALHARLRGLPCTIDGRAESGECRGAGRPQLTMATLRAELELFSPVLSQPRTLVLPRYSNGRECSSGEAEYVNLAALLRGGLGYAEEQVTIESIQRCIEAGWAEGIDPEGGENFGGRLQGKPLGSTNAVGVVDLLTALLHERVEANLIEVHHGPGGGRALLDACLACFEQSDSGGTSMPMVMQEYGHSFLVLGATCAPGAEAILVADPRRAGSVTPVPLAHLIAREETKDHQLLMVLGDGSRRLSAGVARQRGAAGPSAFAVSKPATGGKRLWRHWNNSVSEALTLTRVAR